MLPGHDLRSLQLLIKELAIIVIAFVSTETLKYMEPIATKENHSINSGLMLMRVRQEA
jgi:hypothetical protein